MTGSAMGAGREHKKSPTAIGLKIKMFRKDYTLSIARKEKMDKVFTELSDWLKNFVRETFNKLLRIAEEDENDGYKELMTKTEVAKFLGVSIGTFDNEYRYLEGFPKELPATRWSKRAVKQWLANQI